jgi:hypothetical protein
LDEINARDSESFLDPARAVHGRRLAGGILLRLFWWEELLLMQRVCVAHAHHDLPCEEAWQDLLFIEDLST